MNKKNNQVLAGILTGLIVVFLSTNYFKKNSKALLKTDQITIDPSQISKITIKKPSPENEEITFSKKSEDWLISNGTIRSKPKPGNMSTMLSQLEALTIERLVSKSKTQWATYQLEDSMTTKVIVENLRGTVTKLFLGKTNSAVPTARPYNQYPSSPTTYIRVDENPKIYSIKGPLPSTLKRTFQSWRKNDFLALDKKSVTNIQFNYPDNVRFTLSKMGATWTVSGIDADSTKVAAYLNRMVYKENSEFADDFTPTLEPDYRLKIKGNNMEEILIEGYKSAVPGKFYLHSSMNPSVFFKSDSAGIFKQLFVNKDTFISQLPE